MMKLLLVLAVCVLVAVGAPAADLVDQIPGFPKAPFKVYSGYLTVKGPIHGYDALHIHYEFHESQRNPGNDPLVTWHQGGPGGSSLYGQYGEMGYFQIEDSGQHINPLAWNRIANMLYLESPAGSDDPIGFSWCEQNSNAVACSWNDTTQAEAYTMALESFFDAFPAYAGRELYLTGESYAGQYIPNIAHYILNHKSSINLKGIAVGNGCWGGDEHRVQCNGPNSQQNDIDMFYGKGLVSKNLYEEVYRKCAFPDLGVECMDVLEKASREVGPHNIYNIYDNCAATEAFLNRTGKSMFWLKNYLRAAMNSNNVHSAHEELKALGGGYDWGCDQLPLMGKFFQRADVQQAMHLGKPGRSAFHYDTSGPASITLYPELISKIRVLIYNGDADACVPYKGNEEWTTSLAAKGLVKEKAAWHPWFADAKKSIPAGYATTYSVVANATNDFSFITIRLAGHMVPAFQPKAAFSFFQSFLSATPF